MHHNAVLSHDDFLDSPDPLEPGVGQYLAENIIVGLYSVHCDARVKDGSSAYRHSVKRTSLTNQPRRHSPIWRSPGRRYP
jgi:hypothetical protein